MRPTTTKYYTIPLRSPNGAPPRYVAIPMSANDHRGQRQHDSNRTPAPSKAEMTTKPKMQTAPKPKPNPVQRRARSVPLQEMREAAIDVRDNARRGGSNGDDNNRRDDSSTSISTKKVADIDMPADDLHPLKYWEV